MSNQKTTQLHLSILRRIRINKRRRKSLGRSTIMATEICCIVCEIKNEHVIYGCICCSQNYCIVHLDKHRKASKIQFDQFENETQILRKTFVDQIFQSKNQQIIEQINLWERNSIEKVKQYAEQNRKNVFRYINQHFRKVDYGLNKITTAIQLIQQGNYSNRINLDYLQNKLDQLKEKLHDCKNFSFREHKSTSIIKEISIDSSFRK